ncbi:MAG: putative DNA binding domain-containing protein [Prevotellaceae bacterium]|jgi:ATP-dependent DNA helicase RecG|nr:putative DNA binding domain-containing protein [Prevotellaceae bacterium]
MTETDLIELLHDLCTQPQEQQWLEFKLNGIDHEQIGEYISAISNGATLTNKVFGYLVWGVEDGTHEIKGTTFTFVKAKHGNQDLELWLRSYLEPKINFEIFEFNYAEKQHIVLLRIPPAKDEPVNFQRKAFVRVGSHKTELRKYPDWMRIIYNSQEDWSAKVVANASIEELDPEALHFARVKFKEKNTGKQWFDEIDKWDESTFLDKAKITSDGKITNTAILLLGKPEAARLISPRIAQITWKLETEEVAYEHFEIPFFISVNDIVKRIRNVRYKFFPNDQLIATEVQKYDSEVILEALNNCIAHQDYSQNARIVLVEKVNKLMFKNIGSFFEGKAEDYSMGNITPKKYRNKWLVDAMVNLNMIDSLGLGIHKMYRSQYKRYFPLPDYTNSSPNEVVLEIYGHTIDENYSKLLIEKNESLSLTEIILLDKVQKRQSITDEAAKMLKNKGFIEGRKPNYYVAPQIAKATGQKAGYSKNKGMNKQYYLDFILQSIKQHGSLSRKDIDELLWEKLPDILSEMQKKNKITNLLTELRTSGKIVNKGNDKSPEWIST